LQALLPVPAPLQLPSRLRSLWSGGRSFSSTCWPTLFAVKALSNCNLMVLSRDKFRELLQEYQWVCASCSRSVAEAGPVDAVT
jgi:CRP-like cAMP-binding protein